MTWPSSRCSRPSRACAGWRSCSTTCGGWPVRPVGVLGFGLRRVPAGRVTVLAAARQASPEIEALIPDPGVLMAIGPLTRTHIADPVQVRTDVSLSPQRVAALYRPSGGNPFLALELARSSSSGYRGLEQFPVPARHLQVIGSRLSVLPSAARWAVLAAALSSRPTTALLTSVAGPEGLGRCRVGGCPARFGHVGRARPTTPCRGRPAICGVAAERAMHLTLASASDDPLDRARHLALGRVGQDARGGEELEAVAGLAADRAAIAVATELCRDALERTPADAVADRVRRAVAAARWVPPVR